MTSQIYSANIAIDDKYWAIGDMADSDLRALIAQRRQWVGANAKVLDDQGKPVPAELAEHFVMAFSSCPSTGGTARYLVEGIDKTALITVRLQPTAAALGLRSAGTVVKRDVDVFVFFDPGLPKGPWLFSSHMQLGTDATVIADHLVKAKTDPQGFVLDLNNPDQYVVSTKEVQSGGQPTPWEIPARFVAQPGVELEVLFEGHQTLAMMAETIPIACNPLYGSATVNANGVLELSISAVVVKAYA